MNLATIKKVQTRLFGYTDELLERITISKRDELYKKFSDKLILNPALNRSRVSFQDNKKEPFYRWLKFKEGFSSSLVKYFLHHVDRRRKPLRVLDPFAGSGTTLTTSINQGHHAMGIELLPVGIAAMRARLIADSVDTSKFEHNFERLNVTGFDSLPKGDYSFPHLRITEGAFNNETESAISKYMSFIDSIDDEDVRYLFWFACISILEAVSYTSKDGQYLRWDYRSSRPLKSKYIKKDILPFQHAIHEKLQIMLNDLRKRNNGTFTKHVHIIEGSCLDELANLPNDCFDLVVTSPPYCNRYDYTRTYALELAFLGYDEEQVKTLRQTLLSSTVENKTKKHQLYAKYSGLGKHDFYGEILESFQKQEALHEILDILHLARIEGRLNNNNIPNMVENYFFEMNIVIHELSRILSKQGRVYMVNDNVQYLGEEVPVDLILSDFAQRAGMDIEFIWVLPKGKGNSSQQMGQYGRNEIRKCVYVWSKPDN
jgi:DNA modification methylase